MSFRHHQPQASRTLFYAALFIFAATLIAAPFLRTDRRAGGDVATKPVVARQTETAYAAASAQPATESERKPRAKSVTRVPNEDGGVKPIAHGGFDISGMNRETVEENLSLDPPTLLVRTTPVSASSAMLAGQQNNDNGEADRGETKQGTLRQDEPTAQASNRVSTVKPKPREERLKRAKSFDGDLRNLPHRRPVRRERPEREEPRPNPSIRPGKPAAPDAPEASAPADEPGAPTAPAPTTIANFDGLDFATFGAGHPPDTNGDVGPTYYIQSVNTAIGIYRKSDGVRVAAFTFDDFMSQGQFGNLCDTDNFGDPVVLYDSFEDRWIITDFAFQLDGSNNVINPPGAFQCIAASKTGDPVSGGWNFYSINTEGGLGDYPKFGIWPDGLYMTVSMFGYANGAAFQNPRVYAFNKDQMYAGAPTVQSVSFNASASDFTILPSNARLQTGTPPTGSPNYFISTWQFLNGVSVYKFHVDWNRISLSTFTGPDVPISTTSWPNAGVANAPSLGGSSLDVLQIRAMMQNQYSNIGGAESLWTTHTVRRGNTTGFAAPRWYQVNVTGGTVAANILQAATWDPDAANVMHRFIPSLAVDRMGDLALGYSTSSSTTKPAIKYAGRLASDPVNTFSQTEQLLIQGTGTQVGNSRWGDYSTMTLDPDGCTFWFTSEYYAVDGLNDLTRIGSFAFPGCAPLGGGGTVSGTVTDGATNPISGATVALGSRTTTTNASGGYSFTSIPAGTYPSITASLAGYGSSTTTSVIVADAATTTKDFTLNAAPDSACFVDTSQTDFQLGVTTNTDHTTSPGDVILLNAASVDQQNTAGTTTGTGFGTPAWTGQTFIPAVTGILVKADIQLFCNGCGATPPNLTLSVRNTSGGLPTGADLANTTILGSTFASGSTVTFTASFGSPATLTAGTQYALILRPVSAPAGSGYFWIRSSPSTYASGQRVLSSDSGSTWTADSTRDYNFKTYMQTGFASSGNLVSGVKDANPPTGSAPTWTTLSWNATIPASTSLNFQAAGSNNANGPFNFVGPDGTAATFFTTSGASLSQFNGFRYLKYKALLGTTNSTATPTLSDVTTCFDNITPTITAAATPLSRQQGSAAINSQIATVSDPSQTANTLNVTATPLNGSAVNISNISVDAAGNVTADVAAGCAATNSTFTLTVADTLNATASTTLSVNVVANTAPTLTYNNADVFINGATTINTATGPSDNGSVSSIAVQSVGTYTGSISVDNATGVISISNAAPLGAHTITIRATDGCTAITDASFTLNVLLPDIRINDALAAEPLSGTTPMLFTVSLSAPAGADAITVNYATADQSAGAGHATGGATCAGTVDYQTTSGTLAFVSGERVKTVSVDVCADSDSGEPDETFLLSLSDAVGGNVVRAQATGNITQSSPAGAFLISELRTSGPAGAGDDFIELYNNTDSQLTVSASDASGGYGVFEMGADCNATPVLVATILNGTVIPARGHFLLTGSAYSLGSYAAGDQTLNSDIGNDHNVAVFSTADVSNLSTVTRLDAVGFGANASAGPVTTTSRPAPLSKKYPRVSISTGAASSASGVCDLLREGANLPPLSGSTTEHSYFRKECAFVAGVGCSVAGNPKDTNVSAADFMFADTQGTFISGAEQHLGAPGPENQTSPIRRDTNGIGGLLLDNTRAVTAPPNRARDLSSNPGNNSTFGTLTIRRRITNSTGGNVTRLRFRIVEMTTFPSPGGGQADLRAITSTSVSVSGIGDAGTCNPSGTPCAVMVEGTTLETPNQPNGGGFNSTLAAGTVTVGTPLAQGASINLQFVLGVQTTGAFRFLIIIEALP
jgi:hypothetical protein